MTCNRGKPSSKPIWGAPFVGDPNTLDVYLGYLRKKVEANAAEPQLLHTVRGVGFMARVGDPKALKRNCMLGASPWSDRQSDKVAHAWLP